MRLARRYASPVYAFFFALVFAFFLIFGQPVVVILVLCLNCAPFCPVRVVGMMSLVVQRLPLALAGSAVVSALWGPSGSLTWKHPHMVL
jgi:hypothetical protein